MPCQHVSSCSSNCSFYIHGAITEVSFCTCWGNKYRFCGGCNCVMLCNYSHLIHDLSTKQCMLTLLLKWSVKILINLIKIFILYIKKVLHTSWTILMRTLRSFFMLHLKSHASIYGTTNTLNCLLGKLSFLADLQLNSWTSCKPFCLEEKKLTTATLEKQYAEILFTQYSRRHRYSQNLSLTTEMLN